MTSFDLKQSQCSVENATSNKVKNTLVSKPAGLLLYAWSCRFCDPFYDTFMTWLVETKVFIV